MKLKIIIVLLVLILAVVVYPQINSYREHRAKANSVACKDMKAKLDAYTHEDPNFMREVRETCGE